MSENNSVSKLKLPTNRFESFFDCLKYRFFTLLSCGLILLIFALPLILTIFLRNIAINEIKLLMVNESINNNDAFFQIFQTNNTFNLINIIGFTMLGVGISGVLKIIKLIIWQDSIFFFHDFFSGIKENVKNTSFIFLLFGIFNFLFQYLLFSQNINDSLLNKIVFIFTIVIVVLLFLLGLLIIYQTSIYNLKLVHQFKNAFILLIANFFKYVLIILLTFSLWIVFLFDLYNYYLIIVVLMFVLILPIQLLIVGEYNFHLFDLYINKKHHPDIYKKGIWYNANN